MKSIDLSNPKYEKYMQEILTWNEKVNLTAITDPDEFKKKHFEDSLLICGRKEIEDAENVLDLGTGAGFPGVPLAIEYPGKSFILLDSLEKRLKIIDDVCQKLEITNVETVHARAEDLGQKEGYREAFDICVSRAVARMSTLCEYALPFVKIGGYFAAYKGPDYEEELSEAKKAISILGGEIENIQNVSDGTYDHNIIYVKKVAMTPKKYPRKAGMPSKSPIR